MSHHTEKFNGASPNREGNVSISVSNLGDVNLSSVASTHVLKWDGSQWVSEPATQYFLVGEGIDSVNYNTSHSNNNPGTTNHILKFYSENPINTISNSTIIYEDSIDATEMIEGAKYVITTVGTTDFTALGASANSVGTSFTKNSTSASGNGVVRTNWVKSITLPAGTYTVSSQVVATETGSGSYLSYEVERTSDSNRVTPRAETGSGNLYGASGTCFGTFTLSSSDTIRVVTTASNNIATTANQTDHMSKFNYLLIRKL
tara:strand:- start:8417 stop:9196 length:780 start_codon:yes stop_codon:yes gene_type:complete